MFIFLPLWPRRHTLPVATLALLLINVLVFAVTWPLERAQTSVVSADHRAAAAQTLCHILNHEPSLAPADRDLLSAADAPAFPTEGQDRLFRRIAENANQLSARGRYEWDSAYPIYASYSVSLKKNPRGGSVFQKWGFERGRFFPEIFTHQFLHAGFGHLFFNMLFLWAVGGVVESAGSGLLVAVYLLGGVAAALGQLAWGLPDHQVMVGASGAISAILGFGLATVPRARTRVAYVAAPVLSVRYGAFNSPLWFFVPLWVFQQAVYGLVTRPYGGTTVGYGAHLGGFAAGLAAGAAARYFRWWTPPVDPDGPGEF
ncbi:MAG TPA: rhomboid family intramembrane serine protease [Elusimicrobiota bacterium]|nr:rhomboid family intramembrane serine protease [Elusimicrobiota bacterium]